MKLSFAATAVAAAFALVNAQNSPDSVKCDAICHKNIIKPSSCLDATCICGIDKLAEKIATCVSQNCISGTISNLALTLTFVCAKLGETASNIPTTLATSRSANPTASVTGIGSATVSAGGTAQPTDLWSLIIAGFGEEETVEEVNGRIPLKIAESTDVAVGDYTGTVVMVIDYLIQL